MENNFILTDTQKAELKKAGFEFETLNDILIYIDPILEYLFTHNKNYTTTQYYKIDILHEITRALYNAI